MKSNKRCPAWIGAAVAYPPGHHGKPGPHKMIRPHGMLTDGSCIRQCQVWHPMRFLLTLPMVACLQVRRAASWFRNGALARVWISWMQLVRACTLWVSCACAFTLWVSCARMHVGMHVCGSVVRHARCGSVTFIIS